MSQEIGLGCSLFNLTRNTFMFRNQIPDFCSDIYTQSAFSLVSLNENGNPTDYAKFRLAKRNYNIKTKKRPIEWNPRFSLA